MENLGYKRFALALCKSLYREIHKRFLLYPKVQEDNKDFLIFFK